MTAASATAGPAQKVQSTVSTSGHEFGYPHGHLGHLNAEEEEAFQNFKAFLEEKGVYKPGNPASHDDPTLLYGLHQPFLPPLLVHQLGRTKAR